MKKYAGYLRLKKNGNKGDLFRTHFVTETNKGSVEHWTSTLMALR